MESKELMEAYREFRVQCLLACEGIKTSTLVLIVIVCDP